MRIASSNQIAGKLGNRSKIQLFSSDLAGSAEMGPGYFVIAILGCADGGTSCTPVMSLPTHYSTEAECTGATGAALIDNSQLDYPTLVARCRPAAAVKSADEQKAGAEKRRRG
jgi:hypothetical protein